MRSDEELARAEPVIAVARRFWATVADTTTVESDAREVTSTDPNDDEHVTVEMFGKHVRVSRDEATHWARFHDAPDGERHSWRIDWTTPDGKLVRR